MTTIKKGYTEVHAILIANKDKKVSEILESLMPIFTSLQRDKNHQYVDDRLQIFCYYHKVWEFTDQVEYGSKVSTATGLNSMCKVGTNQWTKQQRDFKADRSNLLMLVANEELAVEDIKEEIEKLDDIRCSIVSLFDHHFDEALLDPRQIEETEA